MESGAIGSKGKEGEGQRLKRREATKKKRKKKEKRRLQLACRERHKNGEPHAPTQRRPTSKMPADWSAKLREKARKKERKRAGEDTNGNF